MIQKYSDTIQSELRNFQLKFRKIQLKFRIFQHMDQTFFQCINRTSGEH